MIPNKIYIGTVTLSSNAPSEEHLLPDWHLRPNPKVANVEYIRKDALIDWLAEGYDWVRNPLISVENLIDKLNKM